MQITKNKNMHQQENDIKHYALGKIPANIIMLGILFQLIGIAFLLIAWYLSLLFFALGFTILSMKDNLAIDYSKQLMMKYVFIFGYKLGKWQDISNAKYIALVRVKTHRKKNMLTIGAQINTIDIKANIIFAKRQYKTLFKLKRQLAMPIVEDIAIKFNIEIHDLTTRQKVILKPKVINADYTTPNK